jgi:hypothetical protein
MSEQKLKIDLQSITEFKNAYRVCVACKITEILSPHLEFIDYVDRRARQKMGPPDGDYRPEYFFASLKTVIEPYVSTLEAGNALEYETEEGKIVKINMVREFKELKKLAGNNSTNYLAWTLAKLREILILKESAFKLSRE